MADRKAALDAVAVAKYWYTEQRGRVVGNTKAWDDLSQDEQYIIVQDVVDVLDAMKERWQWDVRQG